MTSMATTAVFVTGGVDTHGHTHHAAVLGLHEVLHSRRATYCWLSQVRIARAVPRRRISPLTASSHGSARQRSPERGQLHIGRHGIDLRQAELVSFTARMITAGPSTVEANTPEGTAPSSAAMTAVSAGKGYEGPCRQARPETTLDDEWVQLISPPEDGSYA